MTKTTAVDLLLLRRQGQQSCIHETDDMCVMLQLNCSTLTERVIVPELLGQRQAVVIVVLPNDCICLLPLLVGKNLGVADGDRHDKGRGLLLDLRANLNNLAHLLSSKEKMSEEIGENVSWNSRLEEYFASTGEKAHCLSIIHKKAEALYSQRRNFIDLPVIVISSIVGFLSVGSNTMFPNNSAGASIGLGVGSLLVSVLNTTGSYFQWAKKSEGHRISAIHYAKLYRFLNIEMSLPRVERMSPRDLLKYTKDAYDRLQEISPLIPPEIIRAFKREYAGKPEYKDITMPEEANGLERIVIYAERKAPASLTIHEVVSPSVPHIHAPPSAEVSSPPASSS